jgi:hypothetical protein
MKTRFLSLLGSPDASEGTSKEVKSNYSTERSPRTSLLFEATHTVLLPLVRFMGELPSAEELLQTGHKACSVQEH